MKSSIHKISILALSLIVGIIACGKQTESSVQPTDAAARINILKTEIADRQKEIAGLEATLSPADKKERTKLVSTTSYPVSVFKNYIDMQGVVTADQEVMINAKMPGNAEHIYIHSGDRVKAGQVLMTLDDVLLKQGLAEIEHQLSFAIDLYEKQKALWDQKIGTEIQFLSAKNNKESLEKRIATTKEQWDLTRVKAPINGIIDQVMIKPGQTVAPGMPIARLINFSKLLITANVAESYAGKIKQGNTVKIFFPDINKEYDGKISFVSRVINPVNRTFVIEASLPSEMKDVMPNMIAIVKIVDYVNPNAIILPINLLQKDSQGDFVMIADSMDNKWIATKKMVTVGKFYNDNVEIKNGLTQRSQVITNGYQNLLDKDLLSIQ